MFLLVADREQGRLSHEARRIGNEIKDLTEKKNIYEVNEYSRTFFLLYHLVETNEVHVMLFESAWRLQPIL